MLSIASSFGTSSVDQQPITLPKTIHQYISLYTKGQSISNILNLLQGNVNNESFTHTQQIVNKFSGPALKGGRPLDSVLFFMAGASGSGKSSTINSLFADRNLLPTSSSSSETTQVTTVRKQLSVTKENPPILGYLSFIDIPGTFDTNSEREAVNMANIREFKKSCIELRDRENVASLVSKASAYIRNLVYPNVVLFVIKASDDRMAGPDSFLVKSLKAFKLTADLIDKEKNNVIVVLSKAMSLGRKKEKFTANLREKTSIIQAQFYLIFGIRDVEVVPIENEAEDEELEKQGDFYRLPDGQLSHLNLFEAMHRCFAKNQDTLGTLFSSWYFRSNCPEKAHPPQMINSASTLSEEEIRMADEHIQQLQKLNSKTEDTDVKPTFNFQCLAHGYCPVTEEIKPVTPFKVRTPLKTIKIENSMFSIPEVVEARIQNLSRFHRCSFIQKNEYENCMQHKYGIDTDFSLNVKVSAHGRWLQSSNGSSDCSLLTLVQEMQLAVFNLKNPKERELSVAFQNDLDNLPEEYTTATANHFRAFFSTWGTHFIIEEAAGGAIQLDCTIQQASLTKKQVQDVETAVSGIFTAMFQAKSDYQFSNQLADLRQVGVSDEHLQITGGIPPPLTLGSSTSQAIQDWTSTVSSCPAALRSSIKLYPYYNFLQYGPKYNSMREATKEYLAGGLSKAMQENLAPLRDEVADRGIQLALSEKVPNQDWEFSCFPKGALVTMKGGYVSLIEDLHCSNIDMLTVSINSSLVNKCNQQNCVKLQKTRYCTYLDRNDDEIFSYLALEFDNGKKLNVSPGHMIFEFSRERSTIISKQAKHFKVGEMSTFLHTRNHESFLLTPKIVKISKVNLVGAYAPLTSAGTLVVDGFLVTSYANTNCFLTAQASMMPLKLWCLLNEKKANATSLKSLQYKRQGIHSYAKFCMSVRKAAKNYI